MNLNNHEMRVYAGLSATEQEEICELHKAGALEMFTGEWVDMSEQPRVDMLFTQVAYRLKMEVGKWYVHGDPEKHSGTTSPVKLLDVQEGNESRNDRFCFWNPYNSLEEKENVFCGRSSLNYSPATDEQIHCTIAHIDYEKYLLANPKHIDCVIDWKGHTTAYYSTLG